MTALREGRRLFQAAQLIPPYPGHEYDVSSLKHEFFFERIADARSPGVAMTPFGATVTGAGLVQPAPRPPLSAEPHPQVASVPRRNRSRPRTWHPCNLTTRHQLSECAV